MIMKQEEWCGDWKTSHTQVPNNDVKLLLRSGIKTVLTRRAEELTEHFHGTGKPSRYVSEATKIKSLPVSIKV
jgi:hypothetical protein